MAYPSHPASITEPQSPASGLACQSPSRTIIFHSQTTNIRNKDPPLLRFLHPLLFRSPPYSKIQPHIPHPLPAHPIHLRSPTRRTRLQPPQIQRHVLYRSRHRARPPCLLPLPRRRQQIQFPEIVGSDHGFHQSTASRALHHGAGRRDLYVQTGAETLPYVRNLDARAIVG